MVFINTVNSYMHTLQNIPEVQQVDLVPTLAALFQIPIPRNNLGTVMNGLIPETGSLSLLSLCSV